MAQACTPKTILFLIFRFLFLSSISHNRENMAEIFLSASIQVLFDKLLSHDFINYFVQRVGVDTAVNKWKHMLIKIQAVLSDAEEQQITESAVKFWLNDLRDLAYDVEDVLDEFATKVLQRKLMEESQASTSYSFC